MNATQMLVIAIIMPTIVRDIGGASFYTWAAMLYTIGSIVGGASTAMVWSRLGARRAYTLGSGVFAVGTLCCALAPDIGSLIAARGVQGWAGGLVSGSGMALIASLFDVRLRTRIIAISPSTFTACHLSGPIVGGVCGDALVARLVLDNGAFDAGLCRGCLLKDPGPAQPRGRTQPFRRRAISPVRNLGRRRAVCGSHRLGAGVVTARPFDYGRSVARRPDLPAGPAGRQ
jgi:MFS family permease